MLRKLSREFRSFPATLGLCAVWIVVYLAMTVTAIQDGHPLTMRGFFLGMGTGHRYGSMTLAELSQGELWRTLTATFVHYGIIHIALNLFGMYQLGTLVESWYGRAQFLAIYVVIGAGGNLLSGLLRGVCNLLSRNLALSWASNPYIHSGGGSTVVLGLVALCAVAGWRARTRMGDYLRVQMVRVLVLTAILGLLPIIDNWGHAGGALIGALVGLAHPFLSRNAGQPLARWAGALAGIVLLASAGAQYLDDRAEAPTRARDRFFARQQTLDELVRVESEYRRGVIVRAGARGLFMPRDALGALPRAIAHLDRLAVRLDRGSTRTDYRRLRALLVTACREPPDLRAFQEFETTLHRLAAGPIRQRDQALREYAAIAPKRPITSRTTP